METGSESKRKKRWVTVILIGLGLIFLGFVVLRFAPARIALIMLERELHVPVQIGSLDVSILGDTISVRDLRLGQPEGFGSDPMVTVDQIDFAGWREVLFPDRRLAALHVKDVTVNPFTFADGRSNLATWMQSFGDEPGNADTTTPQESDPFAIRIDQISVMGIRIAARDDSAGVEPFLFTLDQGALEIRNLIFGPFPDNSIGSMTLDCEIEQPGVENARIAVASRFGPLKAGEFSILGYAQVTGCLYRTFVPTIPANTDTLLGGVGFDFGAELAIAAGDILSTGSITTSNGSTYSFGIEGSTEEPVFILPETLASVASRMAGGAGRIVGSTLHSGKEVIVGAVDTVASFGLGLLHASGSLLKGMGGVAAGVITADGEMSGSGFDDMTSGTGEHLVGAFTDSTDAISETGSRTSDALQNNPEFRKWVTESPQRHDDHTRSLNDDLGTIPFPPVIRASEPDLQ